MNIFLVFFLCIFSASVHAEVLDRIVAVVEAQNLMDKAVRPGIITQSEVDTMMKPLLHRLREAGDTVDIEKIRARALEALILRTLRKQKAKQLGIVILERDIHALMGQVERENRLPFGTLPETLAREGISLRYYQQELEEKLLQSRLISRVIRPMVTVSEEEVRALHESMQRKPGFEEVRLGQILLQLEEGASAIHVERIRHQAKKLATALRQGVSLAKLASQYSQDASSLVGGDMGWFKRGAMLPKLEKIVFDLPEGAVAGPVRSAQGVHLFKILGKRSTNPILREKSKIRARHILIQVPKDATPQENEAALARIRTLATQLDQGASFVDLAQRHSQDATARSGGDLGWFSEGLMVPPFEEAAFSLAIGETSAPVRTPFGWHLIRVEEKQFMDPLSFEALHKELRERIVTARTKARYEQWLRDLRQRSFVELRPSTP